MGGTRISRRAFLRAVGAVGAAGAGLSVLACQPNTTAQSGGGGPEEKQMALYNWSDYVAPSTVPSFEKKTGIKVTQDFFSSNEELLAKLQAGATGYDVIVPSDYMVSIMIKSDVIRRLDMAEIPNFDNVGAGFRGLPYDPDNAYSVPYQWGTTGILYDRKQLGEITSWDALWDREFEGRVAMMDDVRETVGAALIRLGYSVNTTERSELDEARASLVEQKPLLRGYFSSTRIGPLVTNGDLLLGHVYSGYDVVTAVSKNPDLSYVIPEPAATRWTDNMAIPVGAEHPQNAHRFINHVLDAKVGAVLTSYAATGTPNEAAVPLVDKEVRESPQWDPPREILDRLQIIEDVGETTREYERLWTELKSA